MWALEDECWQIWRAWAMRNQSHALVEVKHEVLQQVLNLLACCPSRNMLGVGAGHCCSEQWYPKYRPQCTMWQLCFELMLKFPLRGLAEAASATG